MNPSTPVGIRDAMGVDYLRDWADQTARKHGARVMDFGVSWKDGRALSSLYHAMQPPSTAILGAPLLEKQYEGAELLQKAISGITSMGVPVMVDYKSLLALGTLKAKPLRVKEDLILYTASIACRIRDSRKGIPMGQRSIAPPLHAVIVPLGPSKSDIGHKKRLYKTSSDSIQATSGLLQQGQGACILPGLEGLSAQSRRGSSLGLVATKMADPRLDDALYTSAVASRPRRRTHN
jgi:hypothetical protein